MLENINSKNIMRISLGIAVGSAAMKKNKMQEINKKVEEFDRFVYSEHTTFLCSVAGTVLMAVGLGVIGIGQYSKNLKNKENR